MPLGSFRFRSFGLAGEHVRTAFDPVKGNRFAQLHCQPCPCHCQETMCSGLDSQKWEEEVGLMNTAGGELVRGGFWYGPLKTLAYKLPVGTIAYLLLATAAALWSPLLGTRRPPSRAPCHGRWPCPSSFCCAARRG